MNPLQQIADNLAALNSDAPEVADAVIKLTNMAAHPSRGVVDEVAERRALNKALDALDALSERWATEIGLDAMCASLAKAADIPAAIRAMAVQSWVEGAYAGRTSHQAAAMPAVPDIGGMVNRFLGWPLPDDLTPDCGISFEPISSKGTKWESRRKPIGTNLLTAVQARAMLEYVLAVGAPTAQQPLDGSAEARLVDTPAKPRYNCPTEAHNGEE